MQLFRYTTNRRKAQRWRKEFGGWVIDHGDCCFQTDDEGAAVDLVEPLVDGDIVAAFDLVLAPHGQRARVIDSGLAMRAKWLKIATELCHADPTTTAKSASDKIADGPYATGLSARTIRDYLSRNRAKWQ